MAQINFFKYIGKYVCFLVDKIEKSKKKETEDLKAFELLEEAACDSSFRSDSSTVKKLIENVSMPSPIPNRSQSHTSTPKNKSKKGIHDIYVNSLFLYIKYYRDCFTNLSSLHWRSY